MRRAGICLNGSRSNEPGPRPPASPPGSLPEPRRCLESGDRPGGRPYPPETPERFEILPGVARGPRCDSATPDYLLIGTTNQPDVARGTQRREVIEAMNAQLRAESSDRRHPRLLRGR